MRKNRKRTTNRGWKKESIAFLTGNYDKKSVKEIAKLLGKSVQTVRWKARELGLSSRKGPWSDREINQLMWYFGHKTPEEMAEMVNRSVRAVISKASELGMSRTRGSFSLSAVIKKTGYTREQILRSKAALSQRWRRAGNVYLINDEQVADLVAQMGYPARFVSKYGAESDVWAPKLRIDACVYCGTNGSTKKKQHVAFGLCRGCHGSLRDITLQRFKIMAMYYKALHRRGIFHHNSPHPYIQVSELSNSSRLVIEVVENLGEWWILKLKKGSNQSQSSLTERDDC